MLFRLYLLNARVVVACLVLLLLLLLFLSNVDSDVSDLEVSERGLVCCLLQVRGVVVVVVVEKLAETFSPSVNSDEEVLIMCLLLITREEFVERQE